MKGWKIAEVRTRTGKNRTFYVVARINGITSKEEWFVTTVDPLSISGYAELGWLPVYEKEYNRFIDTLGFLDLYLISRNSFNSSEEAEAVFIKNSQINEQ